MTSTKISNCTPFSSPLLWFWALFFHSLGLFWVEIQSVQLESEEKKSLFSFFFSSLHFVCIRFSPSTSAPLELTDKLNWRTKAPLPQRLSFVFFLSVWFSLSKPKWRFVSPKSKCTLCLVFIYRVLGKYILVVILETVSRIKKYLDILLKII